MKTIEVNGSAVVSTQPNTIHIDVDVAGKDSDYKQSISKLNALTQIIKTSIVDADIPTRSILTQSYRVAEDCEYTDGHRKCLGFIASHRIEITLEYDTNSLNRMVLVLANFATNTSINIHFSHNDLAPFKAQALSKAIAMAQSSARVMSQSAGVLLGDIQKMIQGENHDFQGVAYQSSSKMASLGAPDFLNQSNIDAPLIEITERVVLIYEIG
jgi:uncharacterized protein YggE